MFGSLTNFHYLRRRIDRAIIWILIANKDGDKL